MNSEQMMLYLTIASLVIALVSLIFARAAVNIARATLTEARQVAERDRRDWAQRKWFDLYFALNDASNMLERNQKNLRDKRRQDWTENDSKEWNLTVFELRKVHLMASVFPDDDVVIHRLLFDVLKFKSEEEALQEMYLALVLEAQEELRRKSLIDRGVLARVAEN
jgi:hypothetical protein